MHIILGVAERCLTGNSRSSFGQDGCCYALSQMLVQLVGTLRRYIPLVAVTAGSSFKAQIMSFRVIDD